MDNFIERLKKFMNENNIRQVDIWNKGEGSFSKSFLSMVIKGEKIPNLELVKALSLLSGKSINWWVYGQDEYTPFSATHDLIKLFVHNGKINSDGSMPDDIRAVIHTMVDAEMKAIIEKELSK